MELTVHRDFADRRFDTVRAGGPEIELEASLLRGLERVPNGNRDEAAKILHVSRATFFRKLKQFQFDQKRPRLVRPPHSA